MATAKKTRTRKLHIDVAHATFGPGVLEEKRLTDSGEVLVVRFPDGATRSLLAAPEFWKTPAVQLAAILVTKAAALEPEPPDDGDEPVMDQELVAQKRA
jgi:hypothetical protein